MIDLAEIRAAAELIAAEALVTPVLRSDALEDLTGATVLCKDESQQRAGAFKFRGAYHRLCRIPLDDRPNGVVAVSSGNHGAAVACAAQILGMRATVHVPHDVPAAKRTLIEAFGAEIVTFDRAVHDREAGARRQVAETGATFVHPFDDRLVMAGQGTTALELHDEVGGLDVLLVPMSGGGLMAGCASAMHQLDPDCELIGVEPRAADDTRRSFAAGTIVRIEPPTTIADGLAVTSPGAATFEINRRLVDEVLTVSETQIAAAMLSVERLLARRVEPSGVVGIAAVLAEPERIAGRRIGVILSGGNIDGRRFAELTTP